MQDFNISEITIRKLHASARSKKVISECQKPKVSEHAQKCTAFLTYAQKHASGISPAVFDRQKAICLGKKDKSRKGVIDKDIKKLVNRVNRLKNFYTTSSCSGRVYVVNRRTNRKNDARWLFVSHGKVALNNILQITTKLVKGPTWFREEGMILHICARTIDDAERLVTIARSSGFKKSGIIAVKNRIGIEISSADIIETIIAKDDKLVVTEKYLKIVIDEANKKLRRNKLKCQNFLSSLKLT